MHFLLGGFKHLVEKAASLIAIAIHSQIECTRGIFGESCDPMHAGDPQEPPFQDFLQTDDVRVPVGIDAISHGVKRLQGRFSLAAVRQIRRQPEKRMP